MPVLLRCPVCRAEFSADDESPGSVLRCQCGTRIRVPERVAPITAELVDQGPRPSPAYEVGGNPYAAPQAFQPGAARESRTHPGWEVGIWRQGRTLVMHKSAILPDVCVKSNRPAMGSRLRRKLTWHPSWVGATLLISPLVYVILAAILTKKATIHIGLSPSHRQRRRLIIAVATLLTLGSSAMTALAVWSNRLGDGPLLIILGLLGVVAGVLFGKYGACMVRPTLITDSHVYIRGCHPDFLAQFPEWHPPYSA